MAVDVTKRIERLQRYKDSPAPILSVYFHLPVSKKYSNETIVNKLQTYINSGLTIKQRKELQNNIRTIVGFMANYQKVRGEETLAFFSGGNNLFEVLHLPYKIASAAHYSHTPYLQPLHDIQAKNHRFLVILNDRKKAIFYTISRGSLEDREDVFDDRVPQDISSIGSQGLRTQRDDKSQRHVREHMHKHFNYIVERAVKFVKNKPIDGVILGGHKTELSQFKEHLPKNLQEKIVGNFVSELQTNFNEIMNKSLKVIAQTNGSLATQVSSS